MKTLILKNDTEMRCYIIDKIISFQVYKDSSGKYSSVNIYTVDDIVYRVTSNVKRVANSLYMFFTQDVLDTLVVEFSFSEFL